MDLLSFVLLAALSFLTVVIVGGITIIVMSDIYPEILEYPAEDSFVDATSGEDKFFPSIKENPSRSLSVIVPAYNEEERLPPMLDECIGYLEGREKSSDFTYEIIVVDDGSSDKTTEVVRDYSKKFGSDKIRCLKLVVNRGKGGAVRLGMLRARGELVLFADADGATKFDDYSKVESGLKSLCQDKKEIAEALAISCGSRAHLEEESIATRSTFRTILMHGFHFIVWLFTVRSVKDTQCGFKLLTRRSARIIFNSLHVERWAFDVEMLFIAEKLGIPITEVGVNWTEIDGSKVTPVLSWIQMGRDILIIYLRYTLNAWRIKGDILTK